MVRQALRTVREVQKQLSSLHRGLCTSSSAIGKESVAVAKTDQLSLYMKLRSIKKIANKNCEILRYLHAWKKD